MWVWGKCVLVIVGLAMTGAVSGQADRADSTWADTARFERSYSGAVFVPELTFSSALDGRPTVDPVRFTPLCFEGFSNSDISPHFGTYFEMGYRQLGYIKQVDDSTRMKFRTWNFGVGFGVKVGNMQRGLFFGGYRFEWPFNYRERRFEGDDLAGAKSGWISRRTPTFSHVLEFGYQFRFGVALRFEYYLNPFHRSSFTEQVNGQDVRPYSGWDDHMIAVSLLFFPFINAYPQEVRGARAPREILL